MGDGMKKHLFKLENWFLLLSILFGLIFAFLVPPNQVPDEDRHFARVYAILEGNFTSQKVMLPRALYKLMPDYFAMPDHAQKFDINSYITNISSSMDYSDSKEFSPAASYSPILYLPQLIGVGLAKSLRMGAHELFVMGRVFSLFLYVIVGFFILKSTPVATRGLFVLLTMPMNIYMAASYSADTVQFCLTLIYLSLIVTNLNSQDPLTKKQIGFFLLLAVLLSLTKPVSLLLILLSFAVPVARFGNQQKKLVFIAAQIGLGLIVTFLWTRGISNNLLPALETVSPAKQLAFVILNPIAFMTAVVNSVLGNLDFYLYSLIGYFGWLTTPLPNFVYLLFFIVLGIAIVLDNNNSFTLSRQEKYIFLAVLSLYVVGLFFILYLYWTTPGSQFIGGIQGRYFSPIFPLLLYLIASYRKPKIEMGAWLDITAFGILVPAILLFSAFTIYQKFFVTCGEQYFSYDGICRLPTSLVSKEVKEKPIGQILEPVTQTFTSDCNEIMGVSMLFGTYARSNSGFLYVDLQDQTAGRKIFEKKIKADTIDDNTWLSLKFPVIKDIKNHEFALTFTPQGSFSGNAVTIWATESDNYSQGKLLGHEENVDLLFQYMCPYGLVNTIR